MIEKLRENFRGTPEANTLTNNSVNDLRVILGKVNEIIDALNELESRPVFAEPPVPVAPDPQEVKDAELEPEDAVETEVRVAPPTRARRNNQQGAEK